MYFQLVNILEQRIEEDSYLESMNCDKELDEQDESLDPFAPPLASQTSPATFRELFERLRRLNVPPAQLEGLLQEMDIRLVFTAHPTEIVRHTVRHKQRRVASLLQLLQSDLVDLRGSGAYDHIKELMGQRFIERKRQSEGRSYWLTLSEKFHRTFSIIPDISSTESRKAA